MKRKEKIIIDYIKSRKWMKLIACVIFLSIVSAAFLHITYLFRNANNREHITGFKNEDELDMVYVGGSAAYVYWETPLAWKEYGITSYNYATDTVQAETIKGEIREVLKTQSPELFVIDARSFVYWENEGFVEAGIRNVTDSMDYSLNRLMTVYDCFRQKSENDQLSYYFDIAKYHTNYEALGSVDAWRNINNDALSKYNGWEFMTAHESLGTPNNIDTKEKTPIATGGDVILRDLLTYCSDENLKVLFVVCPYYVTEEEQEKYNYIKEVVESYGLDFLNTNYEYEKMQLDFTKDFYNINHVNPYGAEKYTKYLADYIVEQYNLPDHRNAIGYEEWNQMYMEFLKEDSDVKRAIDGIIEQKKESNEVGKSLSSITDINEWIINVVDLNYVILLENDGAAWKETNESKYILNQFNLSTQNMKNAVGIYRGNNLLIDFGNRILEADYVYSFDGHSDYNEKYVINNGIHGKIVIGDENIEFAEEGLHIVVYDNNYREVLDAVTIVQDDNEELKIIR